MNTQPTASKCLLHQKKFTIETLPNLTIATQSMQEVELNNRNSRRAKSFPFTAVTANGCHSEEAINRQRTKFQYQSMYYDHDLNRTKYENIVQLENKYPCVHHSNKRKA